MRRLHLVRPDRPTQPPYEKHAAKVIALRARREARADLARVPCPNRPNAA
jgi:hypothetical protein